MHIFFTAEDEGTFSQDSDKDETLSAYGNLQAGNCTITCAF